MGHHKDMKNKMSTAGSKRSAQFLIELRKLCKLYDISIAHEDEQGGFILKDFREETQQWIEAAMIATSDTR